jgi:hypothetical protein
MKRCIGCALDKEETEFYFSNGKPKGRCKTCRIALASEWRKANHSKSKEYKRKRLSRLQKAVNDLKRDVPCKDCGKSYPPYCMEYDHLSDKTHSISRMITDLRSLSVIKGEIHKTDLVCILCHRHRTYNRIPKHYVGRASKNIELIQSLKSSSCTICGKNYHPWQMDFDHLDPTQKYANIAHMNYNSKEKILEEISKCILLCALCHRQKTYESITQKHSE